MSEHERYHIASRNIGTPNPISFVLTYPNAKSLPTHQSLVQRSKALQDQFPLLRSVVRDADTIRPFFQERGYWPDDLLIREAHYANDHSEEILAQEHESMIEHLMANDGQNPLWRITTYTNESDNGGKAYFAISGDHCLVDGRGMVNLVKSLFEVDNVPAETIEDVARGEETYNIKPGFWKLLPVILQSKIRPNLPVFLQDRLFSPLPWPAKPIGRGLHSPGISRLEIPSSMVDSLKSQGRLHGIKTLHPILLYSYALAVQRCTHKMDMPAKCLRVQSPRSMRDVGKGHGHCTALYLSADSVDLTYPDQTFSWPQVVKVQSHLSDPYQIAMGDQSIGLLEYLPNVPGGWEGWLKGLPDEPIADSISFSNLGYLGNLSTLDAPLEDVMWAMAPTPYQATLQVNLLGHQDGIRVITAFRDGAIIDNAWVKSVEVEWMKILESL